MQATLEAETKAKVEALRMKKKLETDVADLETGIYNQTSFVYPKSLIQTFHTFFLTTK